MDATSTAQSALFAAQQPTLQAVKGGLDMAKAASVSKEYESVFISQFLGSMFSGIQTDGITGGGQGEEMFRSLMIDEYGKQFAAQGGFGLAASVQREMLKMQETPVGPANAAH